MKLRCESCKELFECKSLKSENIKFDQDNFVLTFIECDKCGTIYPVFLDDGISKDLEEKLSCISRQIKVNVRRKHEDQNAELRKSHEAVCVQLGERRKSLLKQYQGQSYQLHGRELKLELADRSSNG